MFNFTKVKAACVVLGLLFTSSSFATTIVDTVSQNLWVDDFQQVSYRHDLNEAGENFVLGSALSGSLEVAISDDGGFWDLPEIILFTVEGFDFDTGTISFGSGFSGDLEVNALGHLNSDGYLDVVVRSLLGDFYVGESVLTVEVPAPSTMLIFALALVGLAVRRQRSAKA